MPGTGDAENPASPVGPGTRGVLRPPADPYPQDLARYLAASTGLPLSTAIRVIADVVAYFNETMEEYVCRRHAELRRRQHKNDEIWPLIAAELGQRRFAVPGLSERQLRRVVYT
jgi:hypothetical protein